MIIEIIGWIGTCLLILSNSILNTKHIKYFAIITIIASLILTLYSILRKDYPFIVINAYISLMWIVKGIKGGIK